MQKTWLAVTVLLAVFELSSHGEAQSRFPSSASSLSAVNFHCDSEQAEEGTVCYIPACTEQIAAQVPRELDAAFSYMYLAAMFDDSRRARPGIAKFLYESASEERSHAALMLEYLGKRGVPYNQSYSFGLQDLSSLDNPSYETALDTALKMEISVTKHIHEIIDACGEDFHGADFFTDPILEEQHEGIRKLKGALQEFRDLSTGHSSPALAEYIFDKKVLEHGL